MGRELLEILSKLVEPTLEEEGNISYVPHVSIENPNEILSDEIWMDNTSLDEHLKNKI
jgi:quinol monooxygenase YgiN